MKPHNVKCLNCGRETYVPNYRIKNFKYCSRKCGALYIRIRHKRSCEICQKEFEHISCRATKAKYCSTKCYHQGQREKGKTLYKCHHCEKEFRDSASTKRKYCSKACVNKGRKVEWNPVFSTVRKKMIKMGKVEKCEKCGYNEVPNILGVHHIDKNRNNNSIENLMVVCPNCHSLIHHKHICH